MCMNVSTSCEGALPLSRHLEICLQRGSLLCISWRVSLWSSMRGGGAFTLSAFDVCLTSVGRVASVGLHVLLWVQVVGLSGVDVTNMLIEAVEVAGVSLTSTNHEKQSATLCGHLISIHMWCYKWQVLVTTCSLCCLHFYHLETSVKACSHCIQQYHIPVDSSSTLLLHIKCHRLPVQ